MNFSDTSDMLSKMHGRTIVRLCGASLLIWVAPAIAVCGRWVLSKPDASVAVSHAAERVKAAARQGETLDLSHAEAAGKFLKLAPRRLSTEFGILLPETA